MSEIAPPPIVNPVGWLRGIRLAINDVPVTRAEFADYFARIDPTPPAQIPAAFRRREVPGG